MKTISKLLASTSVLAMATTSIIFPLSVEANNTLVAPRASSNSSFTYCTLPNSNGVSYVINDVNGAREVKGQKAFFYVIKNDINNVNGGRCVGFKQYDFVPYLPGHTTSFDLDSNGLPTNVKISNNRPVVKSTLCEGDDTIIRFSDADEDKLELVTTGAAGDFNITTSSEERGNVLKVKFSRNNYSFTGSSTIPLFVVDKVQEDRAFGFVPFVNGLFQSPAVYGQSDVDNKSEVIKFNVNVNADCDSSTTSSSARNTPAPSTSPVYSNYFGAINKWDFNSSPVVDKGLLTSIPYEWNIQTINDFNRDGNPDLFFGDQGGNKVIWYLNANGQKIGDSFVTNIPSPWSVYGSGDFNRDGSPDLIWSNGLTGQNVIWYMNNDKFVSQRQIESVAVSPLYGFPYFSVVGVADFNRDGNSDLLWRSGITGQNVIWYMNNGNIVGVKEVDSAGNEWRITGSSDLNNDSNPDILFQSQDGMTAVVWYMNNGNRVGYKVINNLRQGTILKTGN